ncbi:MAG: hypothetical protein ACT4QD_24555 [Acidobacteriota bacterium]
MDIGWRISHVRGGQEQVYVRPFRGLNERRWQVSTNGGREPLWARSGPELFYLARTAR